MLWNRKKKNKKKYKNKKKKNKSKKTKKTKQNKKNKKQKKNKKKTRRFYLAFIINYDCKHFLDGTQVLLNGNVVTSWSAMYCFQGVHCVAWSNTNALPLILSSRQVS